MRGTLSDVGFCKRFTRALLWLGALALLAPPSGAATFKWANGTDTLSLDPYAQSDIFDLSFDSNIYEPLVRRTRDLKLEPSLATSWEQIDTKTWRFHLRPDVKFSGGEGFSADDVLFSYQRANAAGSKIEPFFQTVGSVRRVDALTVDFLMKQPNPIFPQEITNWEIMSKAWCEQHSASKVEENFATDHADGTGPFILSQRESGRPTVLTNNPKWWDKPQHNLTDVQFFAIPNAAIRVTALLAGDVDMIYTVPPQETDRIGRAVGLRLIQSPGLRTVFLGMDQSRDELLGSDVKGKNPFKDQRVRQAFYQAIDIEAIHQRLMHGDSHPTGLIYGAGIQGYDPKQDTRYNYDPAAAKQLLAEAGYPGGFGVTLDCPNDRYVNDEAICQAVTAMLGRIGVRVTLIAQSRAQFFARVQGGGYHTSFFMLGWTPNTYDAQDAFFNLVGSRNGVRGMFNSGGYANPTLDRLIEDMAVESDPKKRQAEIDHASQIVHDDVAVIPLHQQVLVWAARNTVELVQLADDSFPLRYVRVKTP
jgi:peptide/nickel transport system substrate-binding protein